MGEAAEMFYSNGFSKTHHDSSDQILSNRYHENSSWFEEEIDVDLKWSFAINSVLHKGTSEYQDIVLLDTKRFGKVLVIDGKMQSAEADEFIYHECLIHPALLCHPNPKTMFIMGGGEGSAAREALKHTSMDKVVMCDIDQEVVDFCRRYLTANKQAFCNKRLHLVINDAKAELEQRNEKFDIIVGDLADPVEGGPCFQLYTKSFYDQILKPKLNHNGIFVTQAGPAGVFTHKEVFSSIYNTIKQVFKYVLAYTAHVPSFADTWGWVMASDQPFFIDAEEIDHRIEKSISGELLYLNGASLLSSTILNKTVSKTLKNETHVYTEEDARFIHGHGVAYRV
ncbi:S-adenosyl-L-methionine-dependent methyltransferases superfamily protein [Actinidia rufa]|uniref:thermospermine synthase n=1 Tax=Actinidia rufa TaxID=165716 RepID=A0A7J0DLT0_9ERIC|nr:S-adenosyl-L-methionine-dependent methyltransferases superfamily protein [Actinidia rufa]